MRNVKLSKRCGRILSSIVILGLMFVILLHHNPNADFKEECIKKVISCFVLLVSGGCFVYFYEKVTSLPIELWQNRHLIWKLAKNDFKKRYAGSYLGMIWAMVQPVVTVLMYWIVFDKIFGSSGPMREGIEVPFVLFLTAGLVPWFFFSEAITNGTMALIEYKYLVKQVVFKISILPIIKVIAAVFIHVFFVGVLLVVAIGYGYYPSIYTIQIIYYSICLFIFALAISYSTCAIVVFFRDLSQIINIGLQIGMWATPILWNIEDLKEGFLTILKLNPLVYIVNGYRTAIYGNLWFWQDFYSTMYFWIITMILFGVGALIFKRLKVHFADVM